MVDPNQIVAGLVARGVPSVAAFALAGNMAVESGFDPGINEIAPLVPGSRGGFGLSQWTGPRRRSLEAYAQSRGADVSDPELQLDFLVHELNTTESRARDAIYGAQDLAQAARLVSERFLRPGIPHLDRRIEETMRIAGGSFPEATYQPPPAQSNALTAPAFVPMMPGSNATTFNALSGAPSAPNPVNALAVADFIQPPPQNALPIYGFMPGQSPFIPG